MTRCGRMAPAGPDDPDRTVGLGEPYRPVGVRLMAETVTPRFQMKGVSTSMGGGPTRETAHNGRTRGTDRARTGPRTRGQTRAPTHGRIRTSPRPSSPTTSSAAPRPTAGPLPWRGPGSTTSRMTSTSPPWRLWVRRWGGHRRGLATPRPPDGVGTQNPHPESAPRTRARVKAWNQNPERVRR